MRATWLLSLGLAVPACAAEPAADRKLDAVRELSGVFESFQAGRPIAAAEKDRAWSALWACESELRPRVVSLTREVLLIVDTQSGPLEGLAQPPSPPPEGDDASERERLAKQVAKLKYPPDVEKLLRSITAYAAIADARVAAETLRRDRPAIELAPREMSFASVGLVHAAFGGERPTIRLRPGVALVPSERKDEHVFQFESAKARYYPIPAAGAYYRRLRLDVPTLDAFRPEAEPVSVERYSGGELLVYADGSAYHRFSQEHLAGVLLHELFHLDTLRLGGGANTQAKELRSFLPQFRLYYRLQERLGSPSFLDVNLRTYTRWLRNPTTLRYFLEAAYDAPEAGGAAAAAADEASEIQRLLRLPPRDFDEARRRAAEERAASLTRRDRGEREYLSYVGVAPPEADAPRDESGADDGWDYRKELEATLAKLPRDAELELEARLEDWWWRRSHQGDSP